MIYPNLIIIKKLSGQKYVKYILLLKATKKLKTTKTNIDTDGLVTFVL